MGKGDYLPRGCRLYPPCATAEMHQLHDWVPLIGRVGTPTHWQHRVQYH